LLKLMKVDKAFLDPSLSLGKLARDLGVSQHHLSQVLNERLGQNFFEFVNVYRVEEAKLKLLERKSISVLAIGEEVGFSSKSAFNSAFKKQTGLTPSQFRDQDPQP
jgi:AraC-like DNA-binding protein